jgi:hypothetical protein
MITALEAQKLLQQRDRLFERQQQLQAQIAVEQELSREMPSVESRLQALANQISEEKYAYRNEAASLSQEIEKAKETVPEKKSPRRMFSLTDKSKLTDDEERLAAWRERHAKLAHVVESGESRLVARGAFLGRIHEQIKPLSAYCRFYQRLLPRVPGLSGFWLTMVDLESEVSSLGGMSEDDKRRSVELAKEVERLMPQNAELEVEFASVCRALESVTEEVDWWNRLLESKFTDLESTAALLDEMCGRDERELEQAAAVRDGVVRQWSEFAAWTREREAYMVSIAEQAAAGHALERDVIGIELTKKRNLVAQLQHKLDTIRAAAARQRLADGCIDELNDRLEREWRERQIAEDAYYTGKTTIEGLRVVLDQKVKVIDDLQINYALGTKPNAKPGVPEFMFVFDVVYTQNRNRAADIQVLAQEISEFEAENARRLAHEGS